MKAALYLIGGIVVAGGIYLLYREYQKSNHYFATPDNTKDPIVTMQGSTVEDQKFFNQMSAFEQKMQGWHM